MKYTKLCSRCQSIQTYSNFGNYNRAVKNDTLCKKCNNREVSLETKQKISKSSIGKPKSKDAVEKMKNSLIQLWKNKTKDEMKNWKEIVSKTSSDRWKSVEYKKRVSNSVKNHWNSLTAEEREQRYINQQNNGAGVCEYLMVNNYIVYGKCEERYIKKLYKNNEDLPINKKRTAVETKFGLTFPDFEYETHFVEIKSLYTFNKMIEERNKTENCQLGKLMWIMENIKDVKILVETSRNKFEDKTQLAILPFIQK
jgi:hypothetical protein